MAINKTIEKNLKRVEKLVDENLQLTEKGSPMLSWIELSPIDTCNRKCEFCPKTNDQIAPDQPLSMPPHLYNKIATELETMQFSGTVMLAGYGEPMLSKHIYDMVAAFSKKGINTEITTNGDLLKAATIKKIIAAGINKIIISLYDGPEQIEHFKQLFSDAGVTEEFYILRDRWYDADQEYGLKLTNRAGAIEMSAQGASELAQKARCYYPHYSMMVDWNGDTFLCTQDWNRRIKSGNLALQSVDEVWHGSILRRYRKLLADGNRKLPPCNKCNAQGTLHGWNHQKVWQEFYNNER